VDLTTREFWALIHGIVLGGAFLLAFSGGLAGFYSLRPQLVTEAGIVERMRRLRLGTGAMAALTWLTVIVGTWVVYPWYREDVPSAPKSRLLASSDTSDWHEFAMEWKEHVAWLAPMLATAAAFLVFYYRAVGALRWSQPPHHSPTFPNASPSAPNARTARSRRCCSQSGSDRSCSRSS
jgi:hypothetical protein